jgi:hypothetical protein
MWIRLCTNSESKTWIAHAFYRGQIPLHTRDALYLSQTEAMRLHYKAHENESIQYVHVMSLYPYICKCLMFPIGHSIIHVGDACKNKEDSLQFEGMINVRSWLKRRCIILSSHTEDNINYCFVYVGHAFSNGTFPVNVSILQLMRGPWLEREC